MKPSHIAVATLLSAMIGPACAAAAVFDFSNLTYHSGTGFGGFLPSEPLGSGAWQCTGGDLCSTNLDGGKLGGAGNDLKYLSSGIGVSASGWYKDKPATVVQDHENGYNAANRIGAGLGVYHQKATPSDDNITKHEKLVLRFDQAVKLEGLSLRSEGHDTTHWLANATFLLNGAPRTLAGEVALGAANLVGKEFTFAFGGAKPDQFYLAGMTVSPVPEPATYALLLSGLAVVGFAGRRRRG
jgi:hypothetical protein